MRVNIQKATKRTDVHWAVFCRDAHRNTSPNSRKWRTREASARANIYIEEKPHISESGGTGCVSCQYRSSECGRRQPQTPTRVDDVYRRRSGMASDCRWFHCDYL